MPRKAIYLSGIAIAIGLYTFGLSNAKAEDLKEYNFIELSQGYNLGVNTTWTGDHPTTLRVGHHWEGKRFYFRSGYEHKSNIDLTKADGETSVDEVNLTIGIKF